LVTSPTPQHRDALAPGTVLNGYQLLAVIGRGGFGITYRAVDLLDQSFAIKEYFPRQFAMRAGKDVVVASESDQGIFVDCRARFLAEAQLLAALGRNGGTPGIVRVATFFEANNTAYLIMELLTGETLDDVIKTTPRALSPQRVVSLMRGILTPLARVHEAGFLHRDIKPANILIRPDGEPVLIDFGSARDIGANANTTFTQVYTHHYAPIEQMMHGTAQGPFSDIYSVGGVGYRAIGGSLVDARARQAALGHALDPLVPAVEVGRDRYPVSLLTTIDKALAVAARDRPQRVEEVLDLLDAPDDHDLTIRTNNAMESRGRVGSRAVIDIDKLRTRSLGGPNKGIASLLRLEWSSSIGTFSSRLSRAWRRIPPQRPTGELRRRTRQRGTDKVRAVIPIIALTVAASIGMVAFLGFRHGQPLPSPSAYRELPRQVQPSPEQVSQQAALSDRVPVLPAVPPEPAVTALDRLSVRSEQAPPLVARPDGAPVLTAVPPASAVPSSMCCGLTRPMAAPNPSPPADERWSPAERRNARFAIRVLRLTDAPDTDGPFSEAERMAIARLQAMASAHPLGGAAGNDISDTRAFGFRLTGLLTRGPGSPRGVRASVASSPPDQRMRGLEAEKRQDVQEAIYWFGRAASGGDLWSCAHLGELLVPRSWNGAAASRDAALLWWVASQGGDRWASYNLGALHDHGIGTPRDPSLARDWYEVAESQGSKEAIEALRKLRP
jgi:serine/threonine protein kinase